MDEALLKARGWSRETKIRRDRRGNWFEDDVLIEHPGVKKAFDSWVQRAPDGRYCLKNSIHWVYVELEGPPVFVRRARVLESGIELSLSNGTREHLNPDCLRQSVEGELYCDVNDDELPALFDSNAMADMIDIIDSDEKGFFILVGETRVYPPVTEKEPSLVTDSPAVE